MISGHARVLHIHRTGAEVNWTLGASLAHQQDANAFQEFRGFIHSLWQEKIGERFALVDLDSTGDQHGRSLRRKMFDFFDQPRTIHTRHEQIGEHQINAATAEGLEGQFAAVAREHAVAPRFEQDFADGKGLFIIVDTENSFFGFHWSDREILTIKFFNLLVFIGNRSEVNAK